METTGNDGLYNFWLDLIFLYSFILVESFFIVQIRMMMMNEGTLEMMKFLFETIM